MQPEIPAPDTTPPLLTIAIPTFNRAAELKGLLEVLLPQIIALPQVEVLVSDNASTDDTPQVLAEAAARFAGHGKQLRIQRHAENIGADGNFASCYHSARGYFFWICGDDDRIVPGALDEVVALLQTADGSAADVDLLYATSYGYHRDFLGERQGDPLGRTVHTIPNARTFARVVNIMFTFISGMIVNKARLDSLPHEDPLSFVGSNLVQLAWTLPLLQHFRKGMVLWTRPVAARQGNAHGYSLGTVFGDRLSELTSRLLPRRPDIAAVIINSTLRRWFPSVLLDVRRANNATLRLHEAGEDLRRAYGRNLRYWLFTWPALTLPLPLAELYTKATSAFSKLLYMLQVPGFWRKNS